jgi:hypothetical protein
MSTRYVAMNVIDYVSTRTGKYAHVEPGDVFDDMNTLGVRSELEHGNIREATAQDVAEEEGGERR